MVAVNAMTRGHILYLASFCFLICIFHHMLPLAAMGKEHVREKIRKIAQDLQRLTEQIARHQTET